MMLRNIFFISAILCTSIVFSQESSYTNKGLVPSSTKLLTSKSDTNIKYTDLQKEIENQYINASKFYNEGAIPTIKTGEYNVILIDNKGNYSQVKSIDFKDVNSNLVEQFIYEKSPKVGALYGALGEKFGIITIKLKK